MGEIYLEYFTELLDVDFFIDNDTTINPNDLGISEPLLIMAENGEKYLLKHQKIFIDGKWTDHNASFLQESIVWQAAKEFNIKIPDCAILNLDDVVIKQNMTLRFKYDLKPGLYFGSKVINETETNLVDNYKEAMKKKEVHLNAPWKNFFGDIYNFYDVPKIIALDLLVLNFDRFSNFGNLLIGIEDNNRFIYVIDHGHCFGNPYWNIDKSELLNAGIQSEDTFITQVIQDYRECNGQNGFFGELGVIFKALEQYIDLSNVEHHSFTDIIYQMENLNPEVIARWLLTIPDEWYVNKPMQQKLYLKFLISNKMNVRKIIEILHAFNVFNNTVGGTLLWKSLPLEKEI